MNLGAIENHDKSCKCFSCKESKKNHCGKMVKRDKAYEIWKSADGTWTWFVLKKYKNPISEAKDEYARWFCDVVTPICPDGEMGDVYVAEIKKNAKKVE